MVSLVLCWGVGAICWKWQVEHGDFFQRNKFMGYRWEGFVGTTVVLALMRIVAFLVRWLGKLARKLSESNLACSFKSPFYPS